MTNEPGIDDKKWVLDRICQFNRDVDVKSGVIIAIIAAIGAILFSNESFACILTSVLNGGAVGLSTQILFWIVFLSLVAIIFALFASFIPRTWCPTGSSIFFGKIAKEVDWKAYKIAINSYCYSFDDDLISQIYINSKICSRKFFWVKIVSYATYILALAITCFAICYMKGW